MKSRWADLRALCRHGYNGRCRLLYFALAVRFCRPRSERERSFHGRFRSRAVVKVVVEVKVIAGHVQRWVEPQYQVGFKAAEV